MQNGEIPRTLLWRHAALMAGREFCYSVELVSVTPVLKILGLPDEGTSWVWLASPIFGLTIGPFIGSWSDRCESKLGRRRPFIIALCIIAMIGLTLLTFAPSIGQLFSSNLAGLVIAIIGSQLMDWGLDSTETPAKAYTLDCIYDIKMQASAINIQTVLTGIGGGCGYLLAGLLGMEHRKELYFIAITVFTISLFLTLSSFKERQYKKRGGLRSTSSALEPPNPSGGKKTSSNILTSKRSVTFQNKKERFRAKMENGNQNGKNKTTQSEQHITKQYQRPITMARGFAMTTTRWQSGSIYRLNDCNSMPAGLDKDDWSDPEYDLSEDESETDSSFDGRVDGFMTIQPRLQKNSEDEDRISATTSTPCLKQNGLSSSDPNNNIGSKLESNVFDSLVFENEKVESSQKVEKMESSKKIGKKKSEKIIEEPSLNLKNVFGSIVHMPKELAKLCVCDLSSWILICTILIYYTDVTGEVCYSGDPSALSNSTKYENYEAGFKMGCFGLVGYSIFMSLCSGLIERFELFQKYGIRNWYILAYLALTLSCIFMFFFPRAEVVLSLICICGACFAVLFTIPLLLLSQYHANPIYRKKSMPGTRRSYGLDCAILISQTYLGQLFMSIGVGPLIKLYGSPHIIFLISSVVSSFGAVAAAFLVHYKVTP